MQIFNVGPLELLFILILAFVILGPQDMVTYSRRLGRLIYRFLHSPLWYSLTGAAREFQELPRQVLRDAAMEESLKELYPPGQAMPVIRWEEMVDFPRHVVEADKTTLPPEQDITADKP
jgi:hypothetical protein